MIEPSKVKSIGSSLLLSIIHSLFILSFSVLFTLHFKPLYYFDIHYLNIEQKSGLGEAEIKNNYDALIRYNSYYYNEPLEFPTFPMSETGRIHFEDVKDVFEKIFILCVTTLILGFIGTLNHKNSKDYLYLKLTSILTLALPFVVGTFIAINWEKAFVTFHKIFFRNDYWWFDVQTDPVITILPDAFFLHCAILILILTLLGSAVCGVTHRYLKRKALHPASNADT